MTDDTQAQARGRDLVARAHTLGFALAGIASLEPIEHAQTLRDWLNAGKHGSMGYLANHADVRTNPATLIEGARAALVVADLYATREDNRDEPTRAGWGCVARYARGRDYHDVMTRHLLALADDARVAHPGGEWKGFVDTAPVPERELASRAGIGWTGKHTLTIHPKLGSYMLLGGVVTTLEVAPPGEQASIADHCGTCTRCIDACPTDAITPYAVDARRCVSYLTIERREPIDEGLFAGLGDWVYGCDICQEVCPHNSPKQAEVNVRDEYTPRRDGFDLLQVLGWGEDERREAFTTSAMKRATLSMMQRNALIVLGNQGLTPETRARFELIAADGAADPMVRRTAAAVLERASG